MVRFIIKGQLPIVNITFEFTFQYGQIYYHNSHRIVEKMLQYLHSNMVRFIIYVNLGGRAFKVGFTFQYGQIYYNYIPKKVIQNFFIYIPIWLDLLFAILTLIISRLAYLHSNMVRFIINDTNEMNEEDKDLHSNMVRFIIGKIFKYRAIKQKFTFQYGQIYYIIIQIEKHILSSYLHSNMVRFIIAFFVPTRLLWKDIYIPIWLDLLSPSSFKLK